MTSRSAWKQPRKHSSPECEEQSQTRSSPDTSAFQTRAYCEHRAGCWVNSQKMNVESSGQPACFIDGNSQISRTVVDLPGWKLLTGPECASPALQQFADTHPCCSISLFCIPLTVSYKSIVSFGPSHLLGPCAPVSPTETLYFPDVFSPMGEEWLPWLLDI